MPAGPRKVVERHNGRVYWPTRDVAVGSVDFLHAPGRILVTQSFRAAEVGFYLHKKFRAAEIRMGAMLMKMAVFFK